MVYYSGVRQILKNESLGDPMS